jgi:hypothetical protein
MAPLGQGLRLVARQLGRSKKSGIARTFRTSAFGPKRKYASGGQLPIGVD